jgi:hemerythrin-like metal-binding protein
MTTLTWQPEFVLNEPRMDDTHREFVDLLAATENAAPGAATAAALRAFVEHTEAHFAQEERWMKQLGFAAENCHSMQHQTVLQVVREVARRHAEAADADEAAPLVAQMVGALAQWFPIHASMMDAALAMTMAERGFDVETGCCANALPEEAAAFTGCGAKGCG